MDAASLAQRLREAATAQLESILQRLPQDPESRFVWFLEIQRIFDVHTIQRHYGDRETTDGEVSFLDILRFGMNLATVHLLLRLKVPFALPLGTASDATREAATRLLYSFGLVNLARRTADMVEQGFLLPALDGETVVLRDSGTGAIQLMDQVERDILNRAEAEWSKSGVSPQGWAMRESDELEGLQSPGAFWARPKKQSLDRLSPEQLRDLMVPLIKPWRIPQGTLMGYDAIPEIDDHFLDEAGPVLLHFQEDAGIHPSTDFGKFTGVDLLKVTWMLLSFFRKHVIFGLLAQRHVPEISTRESLTIWGPKDELAQTISNALGMQRSKVKAVLKALTVGPRDTGLLEKETTPLLPMLIDLGNGYILKPVSSLSRNPLAGFHTIARWRNPSSRNAIALSRESWMRDEIYSVFGGRRYTCVDGNIALRKDGKKLTDVDAAVFDRTNGELALIQIKWQDYSTNDVRELRSKARNLATEVDTWGDKVTEWLSVNPPDQVAQSLRLKLKGPQRITSVFLFVVSRTVARTHGYGFPVTNPFLSVASWPQFRRVRLQVGPAPSVIGRMHEALRQEEGFVLSGVMPLPVDIELQGLRLRYVDLWNKWDEASRGVHPENPEEFPNRD